MEITPLPITPAQGVEPTAAANPAPAGAFSNTLAGAANQGNGPPGSSSPPGTQSAGEGVETQEPNAQSPRPDFLPKNSEPQGDAPKRVPGGAKPTSPSATVVGADISAIVGALALQMAGEPAPAEPAASGGDIQIGPTAADPAAATATSAVAQGTVATSPTLTVVLGGLDAPAPQSEPNANGAAGTAGADPGAPQNGGTTAIPPTGPQPAVATATAPPRQAGDLNLADVAKLATGPGQGSISVAQAQEPWRATAQRALTDLDALTKNQTVLDRQTTAPDTAASPTPPATDFFHVQAAGDPMPAPGVALGQAAAAAAPSDGFPPAATTPVADTQTAPVSQTTSGGGASVPAASGQQSSIGAADQGGPPPPSPAQAAKADVAPATTDPTGDHGTPTSGVQATAKPSGSTLSDGGEGSNSGPTSGGPSQVKPGPAQPAPVQPTDPVTGPAPATPTGTQTVSASQGGALNASQTAQVVRQIVDRAEALAAASPRGGVVVHLEPKDLGSITLTIKSVGNQVDAQIGATNEHVRSALEQNRGLLGQAMQNRGLNLNSVTIDDQTTGSNYAQTHQQAQQQARQAQGRPATTNQNDVAHAPDLETIRKSVRKADGVDIWT